MMVKGFFAQLFTGGVVVLSLYILQSSFTPGDLTDWLSPKKFFTKGIFLCAKKGLKFSPG